MKISILNYQMGNIHSVQKQIVKLGGQCDIISTPDEVLKADKIILPGVGHFGKAMEVLISNNLVGALNEAALVKKIPFLGICLGMQLMTSFSEEGEMEGLKWFDFKVEKFKIKDTVKFKVPHCGWNSIFKQKQNKLLLDLPDSPAFYFVHAYHIPFSTTQEVLATTDYEHSFVSAIARQNIYGVQFHPEKSHEIGKQLLKNFISL